MRYCNPILPGYQGMDGPIMAEKPTNLFLLEAATSDKGARRLLRNFAKVGALQFGDLSLWVMSHCFRTFQMPFCPFQHLRTDSFSICGSLWCERISHLPNAILSLSATGDTTHLKQELFNSGFCLSAVMSHPPECNFFLSPA